MNKIVMIIGGGVALGGLSYYAWKKSKESAAGDVAMASLAPGETVETPYAEVVEDPAPAIEVKPAVQILPLSKEPVQNTNTSPAILVNPLTVLAAKNAEPILPKSDPVPDPVMTPWVNPTTSYPVLLTPSAPAYVAPKPPSTYTPPVYYQPAPEPVVYQPSYSSGGGGAGPVSRVEQMRGLGSLERLVL